MATAELDLNAWYVLTTARVTTADDSVKVGACLQETSVGLRVFGCGQGEEVNRTMLWQFQRIKDKAGRYVIRSKQKGLREQFSVCWNADEVATTKTVGCMRRSTSDDSQQWDVADWGDGMYDLANVANGTKYRLDVHPGSNTFINDMVEGTNGVDSPQYAQRWIMTSHEPVNNKALSTIIFAEPTTTAATTAEPTGEAPSAGLSAGAAAGIGIGASLAGIGLLGAAFFIWRRRRRRARSADSSEDHHADDKFGPSHQTHPTEADASQIYEAHAEPPVYQAPGDSRENRHEMP